MAVKMFSSFLILGLLLVLADYDYITYAYAYGKIPPGSAPGSCPEFELQREYSADSAAERSSERLYEFARGAEKGGSKSSQGHQCRINLLQTSYDSVSWRACFTADIPAGVSDAIFSWDFDGDGTVDTTTTSPEICYTYELPDTYRAKVTASWGECEVKDSARVETHYCLEESLVMTIDLSAFSERFFSLIPGLRSNPLTWVYFRVPDKEHRSCGSGLMFYHGRFVGEYEEAAPALLSPDPARSKVLMKRLSLGYDCDANGVFLIDTLGNIVWEGSPIVDPWHTVWSPDRNILGYFEGIYEGMWAPFVEWFDYYVGLRGPTIVDARTGTEIDSVDLGDRWAVGVFTRDVHYFYAVWPESLVGYRVRSDNYHFERIFVIKPIINYPPDSLCCFREVPVITWSSYDNNVYVYAAYSSPGVGCKLSFLRVGRSSYQDYWDWASEPYLTVEAVCLDTIGNILWHKKTDSLYVSVFGADGRYLVGYSRPEFPRKQVVVWDMQQHKVILKENLASMVSVPKLIENGETGHILLRVTTETGNLYYAISGQKVRSVSSEYVKYKPPYHYELDEENHELRIYKVRW